MTYKVSNLNYISIYSNTTIMKNIAVVFILTLILSACKTNSVSNQTDVRDLSWFLERLINTDHMPELEDSHTAMASTWDTTGSNNDGYYYKGLKDTVYVILDKDGPGCIHRIFTGRSYLEIQGTRLQLFVDGSSEPVFDVPVSDLFDPARSPFPYPLASNKTYPGILFPFPYEKHIKVQLYNPLAENWGNYWQVTYTTYAENTPVKSIHYPFTDAENRLIKKVCDAWLYAERNAPTPPANWTIDRKLTIKAGSEDSINLEGCGIVKQFVINGSPNIPESWRNTRFIVYWDGTGHKSIDVPLGYFFGNADYASLFQYHSLVTGITPDGAYSLFPMPFANGGKMVFRNENKTDVELTIKLDIEKKDSLASNFGRFHATFSEVKPYGNGYDSLPRFGKSVKPFFITLDKNSGPGKYVGTQLHVAWPVKIQWWGEGDWLIWTDEEGFPPSYHGTGTEEYFNSGWCFFDRKAISGFVKMQPGNVDVYSYHFNDAFQFQHHIRTSVEIWWWQPEIIKSIWGATAFWYANPPQDAGSMQGLVGPRLIHKGNVKGETGVWEDEGVRSKE